MMTILGRSVWKLGRFIGTYYFRLPNSATLLFGNLVIHCNTYTDGESRDVLFELNVFHGFGGLLLVPHAKLEIFVEEK